MSEYSYHFSEYNSSEFDHELMENKHICPKNFLFDIIDNNLIKEALNTFIH